MFSVRVPLPPPAGAALGAAAVNHCGVMRVGTALGGRGPSGGCAEGWARRGVRAPHKGGGGVGSHCTEEHPGHILAVPRGCGTRVPDGSHSGPRWIRSRSLCPLRFAGFTLSFAPSMADPGRLSGVIDAPTCPG